MATIYDVARLAGVSAKTVSRVINNENSVRPATLDKVNKAIETLNYKPLAGARAMRSNKSGLIGVITSILSASNTDPLGMGLSVLNLVRGIQEACKPDGKTLLIVDAPDSQKDISDLLKKFESHRVEGVIYAADALQPALFPKADSFPLVLANCFDVYDTPSIIPDDYSGQKLATQHLIDYGHRQLAYISFSDNMTASRYRRQGFMDACSSANLNKLDVQIHSVADFDYTQPFADLPDVLDNILHSDNPPTAYCFGNDLMAIQAAKHFRNLGIRVPEDVSIVGYDNDEVLINHSHVDLTTITLPYHEIGIQSYQALAGILNKQPPMSGRRTVGGELITRTSVRRLNST